MNLTNKLPYFIIILLAIVFLTLQACDTTSSGDDHDHHADDVDGLELIHDGDVYIRYSDGVVEELVHDHYHEGEEYSFTVRFIDHDGDHIHDDVFDEDYSLAWVIENEQVLAIEQHEGDGRWDFHLVALHEGESKVQFRLMHGGHSDYDTLPVTDENAIEFHIDPEDDDHDH